MIRLVLAAWLALCGVANAQLSGGVGGFPGPGTAHSTGTPPTASFNTSGVTVATTATQTFSMSFSATAQKFIVVALNGIALGTSITSVTVAPNVGTTVALSLTVANNSRAALYQGVFLSDADTATSATVTITYSGNPGVATGYAAWFADSLNMSSQTAVTNGANNASASSLSTTVATTAGGFIIATARGSGSTFSGMAGSTETFTTYTNNTGQTHGGGFANGVATNASSTVNANFGGLVALTIVAASWR